MRLGSKSENRASLTNNDSGFSSLPPSTSTSSSTSPPESSSNTGDSDSDQDKAKERRSKVPARPKTKKLLSSSAGGGSAGVTPAWVSAVSPLSSSICEKCEAGEVTRMQLEGEVERLTKEVASTRQTVLRLHEREEKMKER